MKCFNEISTQDSSNRNLRQNGKSFSCGYSHDQPSRAVLARMLEWISIDETRPTRWRGAGAQWDKNANMEWKPDFTMTSALSVAETSIPLRLTVSVSMTAVSAMESSEGTKRGKGKYLVFSFCWHCIYCIQLGGEITSEISRCWRKLIVMFRFLSFHISKACLFFNV